MTTTNPYAGFGTRQTDQGLRVPGRDDQVKNNQGGFVFAIDALSQFKRFLVLGTANGSFYESGAALTRENGEIVLAFTKRTETHIQAVDALVEISLAGRAPKQDPTLFALAILCQHGTTEGKQYARKKIIEVVRTGTHLFTFVGYLSQFGGWSRGLRREVGAWYTSKTAEQLAYQLVKYRSRAGYTHRDVLRLTHPTNSTKMLEDHLETLEDSLATSKSPEDDHHILEGIKAVKEQLAELKLWGATVNWTVKGEMEQNGVVVPHMIRGFDIAQKGGALNAVQTTPGLPWEALPDEAMNSVEVWDAMLDNGVPITALMRQLPRLTKLGLIPQIGGRTDEVVERLTNKDLLAKARVHPIQVLTALKTYQRGHGMRSIWEPTSKIVDGLDEMFYSTFDFIEPHGKNTMKCLDVSLSMTWPHSAGKFPLTAQEITAALAMVTARTEKNYMFSAFSNYFMTLDISPRMRLDDVIRRISDLPHGGTDCSLPMIHAARQGLEIELFEVYTDNETRHGSMHPFQALQQYRRKSGINAKLVVLTTQPTKFSIADPTDPGMLDISGFDTAVPSLISNFARGDI
jgi:60 kDa SS-A/Ro ribonucleoprotein